MDYFRAFKATVRVAQKDPWWTNKKGCTVAYLVKVLDKLSKDRGVSEQRVSFLLGWAQAVVCAYSPAGYDAEFFKELNKKYSGGKKKRK